MEASLSEGNVRFGNGHKVNARVEDNMQKQFYAFQELSKNIWYLVQEIVPIFHTPSRISNKTPFVGL